MGPFSLAVLCHALGYHEGTLRGQYQVSNFIPNYPQEMVSSELQMARLGVEVGGET